MKRLLIALYMVAVHAALVLAILKPGVVRIALGQNDPWISRMHAVHVSTDSAVPSGAAVFLGDSITQRLPASLIAPDAINYGIGSQTSRDLARHATAYRAVGTARVIYLLIGVNDLAAGESPDFEAVLAALPATTPLVWTGVMTARGIEGIDQANSVASELCARRANCRFVAPQVTEADLESDGVHLAPSGYAKWVKALRGD